MEQRLRKQTKPAPNVTRLASIAMLPGSGVPLEGGPVFGYRKLVGMIALEPV
jgi:hypothetical protein